MASVTMVTSGFLFLIIVSVACAFPQLIFPGTRWCGAGDIAKNDDDLGEFKNLDACCRTHDHCPRNIIAGKTKWGETDKGAFTLSDCDCDYALRDCLKKTKTKSADAVGEIYFNAFDKSPCLRFADNGTSHFEVKPKYKSELGDILKTLKQIIG